LVGTLRDISDRKQLEEMRRATEALREDLSNMITHDMRAPVQNILMGLELIARTSGTDESVESVEIVRGSAQRLCRLIDQVLDVARLEDPKTIIGRSAVLVHPLVHDSLRQLSLSFARHAVQCELASDLCVWADGLITQRIITNLLDNAFKHTSPGTRIRVHGTVDAGTVRICVSDDGPGIPAEVQARVFDKFVSEHDTAWHRRSTGLGLAFCRLAVEAMDGQIGVSSEGVGGTTFWFELPRCDAATHGRSHERPPRGERRDV
jgi:signal transduction histidine kinase